MEARRDQYSGLYMNFDIRSCSWGKLSPALSFPLLSNLAVCKQLECLQCTVTCMLNSLYESEKAENAIHVD